jgi:predicted phosphodiesterase
VKYCNHPNCDKSVTMGLKFLHISDIHFQTYNGKKFADLDATIQDEIQLDLQFLRPEYGKINAFLIGGDIASSGKKEEYKKADSWIQKICEITGCANEDVFTVPGNHDVDRDKHILQVRNAHALIKGYKGDRVSIDAKILEYLQSPVDGVILNSPFENYVEFASKYGSAPEEGNFLYWEHDFLLDGSILTIRGVNSAIVSNKDDHEHNSKLVLGTHQALMTRKRNKINIILCHHPPSWLADGQKANEEFASRARLHLFGHKHVFEAEAIDGCLILAAGAMQPERHLPGWVPRYNIIDLSIPSVLKEPALYVKLYKRKWNSVGNKFVSDHPEDRLFEEYTLPLSEMEIEGGYSDQKNHHRASNILTMSEPVIDLTKSPDPMRKLAYLFWGLPDHIRIEIGAELELLQGGDDSLTDIQLATQILKRAATKNLLYDLWEKVGNHLPQKLPNPFKK